MSKRLERRLRLLEVLVCRMKYFCAWEATWVGVRVRTKCREMPRQSPFPSFSRPARNRRCSSSVQGTPFFRSFPADPAPVLPAPSLPAPAAVAAAALGEGPAGGARAAAGSPAAAPPPGGVGGRGIFRLGLHL